MNSPYHDRLDLKLDVYAYTAKECGSINGITGQKVYCSQDCPSFALEYSFLPTEQFEKLKALLPK